MIFLVQISFLSMVTENVGNLILAKCFVYNYHWKKSSETYISICCVTCLCFLLYNELFWSKKIKYFFILRSKSMFCKYCFLSQVKNIGSINRYFHTFPFQDCFVFYLIKLFLKGFLVISDLLKTAFEKKVAEKNVNKSQKVIK